jgi:hypothetical protein
LTYEAGIRYLPPLLLLLPAPFLITVLDSALPPRVNSFALLFA